MYVLCMGLFVGTVARNALVKLGIPSTGGEVQLSKATPLFYRNNKTAAPRAAVLESRETDYFRFASVRSADSLAIKAAPHQFEPRPLGLIAVTLLLPLAVKSLVNALQSPLLKLVSL